ncbi:hypothetical protein TSAR_006666 [Trichomalopsis sarcophagae]|uniref:Uncharacterized protein n=1 Tax=Trichomalopsis sarcophagae TaxID=543379 RepID=A0A232ETB6_9HYME|nr:hypothetical protein TSAR_006666 [Trichomalopsis sarcophagae]
MQLKCEWRDVRFTKNGSVTDDGGPMD